MVSRSVMAVIIYLFMYFLLKRDVGLMSKEPGGLLVGGAGVMGHKPHTLGPEAPLQSGGSLGGKCSSAAGKALPRPRGCPSAESARAGTAALTYKGVRSTARGSLETPKASLQLQRSMAARAPPRGPLAHGLLLGFSAKQ